MVDNHNHMTYIRSSSVALHVPAGCDAGQRAHPQWLQRLASRRHTRRPDASNVGLPDFLARCAFGAAEAWWVGSSDTAGARIGAAASSWPAGNLTSAAETLGTNPASMSCHRIKISCKVNATIHAHKENVARPMCNEAPLTYSRQRYTSSAPRFQLVTVATNQLGKGFNDLVTSELIERIDAIVLKTVHCSEEQHFI